MRYTFSAGPAMMPKPVLEKLANAILDYEGKGISLAELSHRDTDYKDYIFPAAKQAFKDLLSVPDDYEIIFTAGGASSEFGNVVRNLVPEKGVAQYIDTGNWSDQAFRTAEIFEVARLVRKIESIDGLQDIEGLKAINIPDRATFDPDAAFVHITANETIGGIQYPIGFPFGNISYSYLVADMSSEFLTRPFNMKDFGMVYAAGQKNIGLAGFSVVIVRKELLQGVLPGTIDVENYKKLAENDSAINTPPTVAVYIALLMAEYVRDNGGVHGMALASREKTDLVYNVIDASKGFYVSPIHPKFRSIQNIPFLFGDKENQKELEKEFKQEAAKNDLLTLGGHRSVGGLRASIYIGMPYEGAELLATFMKDFAERKG